MEVACFSDNEDLRLMSEADEPFLKPPLHPTSLRVFWRPGLRIGTIPRRSFFATAPFPWHESRAAKICGTFKRKLVSGNACTLVLALFSGRSAPDCIRTGPPPSWRAAVSLIGLTGLEQCARYRKKRPGNRFMVDAKAMSLMNPFFNSFTTWSRTSFIRLMGLSPGVGMSLHHIVTTTKCRDT